MQLPLVEVPTHEEDEEEFVKIRARLYRYDTADHEWKVRINFLTTITERTLQNINIDVIKFSSVGKLM